MTTIVYSSNYYLFYVSKARETEGAQCTPDFSYNQGGALVKTVTRN